MTASQGAAERKSQGDAIEMLAAFGTLSRDRRGASYGTIRAAGRRAAGGRIVSVPLTPGMPAPCSGPGVVAEIKVCIH